MHHRLAPRVEHDGRRGRRHLVDDLPVEPHVHVALRPADDAEAGRAHDAAEVAVVRRLDVEPVGKERPVREPGLVGRPLDGHVGARLKLPRPPSDASRVHAGSPRCLPGARS